MPARILYVDDEDDIREIAEMSLELEPEFEVRSCASGAAARVDAAAWRPDLNLLDVMMPDMDAPETLRRLAASPPTASIPVVFITARTQTHEVERYLAMGAVGVIAKPFDPMALAGDVKKVLASRADGPVA